ncbi:MAG: CRISPR-associated endonuclease Cas2 [Gammaproteobacteria bacterium]
MSRLWMISYDIEDDKVRRRVSDLLKNHGKRVQYSVFECWLSGRELTGLRVRLQREIDEGDRVRWYPLCRWCSASVEWFGQGSSARDEDFHVL